MLPVEECRESLTSSRVWRRRRSNQGFVGFDFRRLSSEEQVNEMVSCFFHLHVKFVRACASVFTSLLCGRAMCSARAWRERRQCCTFPQNPFAGEHTTREWVRSFLSVECCSTSSISATIPEAPRLLPLNGYSCFWKDPSAREMNGVAGQQAAPSFIILILFSLLLSWKFV